MNTYEKKYKKLVSKIEKAYLYAQTDSTKAVLEEIRPELKESEDERIRQVLIDYFDNANKSDENPLYEYGIYTDKVINWLEKQGEQKPIANIKPKFKVGDWVVNKLGDSWHIDSFDSKNYQISNGDKYCYFPIGKQNEMHLWTIDDTKEGDVLVASDNSLFIFAKDKDNSAYYHFSLSKNGSQEISDGKHAWETANSCHPATKEQRELLFQKMKEAGYEWDKTKKELKKIEKQGKSKWSEEDESKVEEIVYFLDTAKVHYADTTALNDCIDWLKSLKQKQQ